MRPRRRSVLLVGALGAVAAATSGWLLATPGAADDGADLTFTRQHLQALDAAVDAVRTLQGEQQRLRAQVAALEERLDQVEQRTGLEPPSPTTLTAFSESDARLEAVDVAKVEQRGTKPRRTRVAAEVPSGGPYVLTWWATWCKPCTSPEELALLARLRGALAREGISFLSVDVDPPGTADQDARAGTWLYPYLQAKDAHLQMLPRGFVQKVGVDLPLHVVVDASGRIVWFRKGALSEQAVRELVTAALAAR
ncbi:MAG: redoxin domain-containing protein [Deltaproteobacteria bacterium]|nr:redoxin domain-containing protein [Deltaproteobacteria bacterium]MCB9785058.1 redoxin domain-containing protein [Deltaproteobacteria bacterium]